MTGYEQRKRHQQEMDDYRAQLKADKEEEEASKKATSITAGEASISLGNQLEEHVGTSIKLKYANPNRPDMNSDTLLPPMNREATRYHLPLATKPQKKEGLNSGMSPSEGIMTLETTELAQLVEARDKRPDLAKRLYQGLKTMDVHNALDVLNQRAEELVINQTIKGYAAKVRDISKAW